MRGILAFICVCAFALTNQPAHAQWREATSANFVVVSDGSERELIRMSQRLEATHWMLGLLTGITPGENTQKVRIYLVDSIGDVHRAMGVRNSDAAGFYRPDISGAMAVVPRSEGTFSRIILFHEYAHHFMLQYMDTPYPGWLVEGFAEFVSTASFEREGTISIGAPAEHRRYEIYDGMPWTPMSRLVLPPSATDRGAGTASYGQYWLVAHYLISTEERRMQLNAFSRALTRGTPYNEAYGVFGDLEQLDREIRGYRRRNSYVTRFADLPPNVMVSPTVRLLRPGEAAIIELEFAATRHLDDAEQATLLGQISAVVAQHPTDPAVALLHTRILFDQERWVEVEAAANRVLAHDPTNARAKTYKGWAALQQLRQSANDDTAAIAAARRLIVQGNRAAPNDPLHYIAYYHSFGIVGQEPTDIAVDGLMRATELLPQSDDVRMEAALALLAQQRTALARRYLAPLAFSPHASPAQSYALQLLGWIDNGASGEVPGYVHLPVAPAL
jgi:tetratricopeptide (TPR) repeat protein